MLLARLEREPEIETALHASFERLLARYRKTRPISEARHWAMNEFSRFLPSEPCRPPLGGRIH